MTEFLESIEKSAMSLTLPSEWYLSETIFALEKEHIFLQDWVCVGRDEEIAKVGDHKVLSLFGESILLLRNNEHELRAFYNVCRHRGAQLCPEEEQEDSDERIPLKGGVVGGKAIMCPYHAWTYDLNGRLIRAPHLTSDMGLNLEDIRLHPVAVESWGGFVFLHLSPEQAKPFSEHIAASAERFARYPLAELAVAKTLTYSVNANWKVLCENYNECYHCGPVHPELCQLVPAFKENGGADLDWDNGVPHREGATSFTLTGTTTREAFPDLDVFEKERHKGDLIYPNLFLSLAADHVAVFILHAEGPKKTRIDCHFLFAQDEINRVDFDSSDAVDFWHLVNRQDWTICERVQIGMDSRVHKQGVFSPMEDWNLDIRKYVKDRIGPYVDV
jgi:Rieske 2Fe-2S family protein